MRLNIFLAIAMFLCVVPISAQDEWAPAQDTITNAEADTLTWATKITRASMLFANVPCDSLSGSTAGTVKWQAALIESPGASDWYTLETDTVNGVSSSLQYSSTAFPGKRFRAIITGSGTQVFKYKVTAQTVRTY